MSCRLDRHCEAGVVSYILNTALSAPHKIAGTLNCRLDRLFGIVNRILNAAPTGPNKIFRICEIGTRTIANIKPGKISTCVYLASMFEVDQL